VGTSVFATYLTYNPFWWIALVLCFAIGLLITRPWSGKPALWITLAVTELFPVGLFALFLMVVSKMKEAMGK